MIILEKKHKKHNPNCAQIPDHPYRILIIRDYKSGKINSLLNLINHERYIDKTYLRAKDPCEAS